MTKCFTDMPCFGIWKCHKLCKISFYKTIFYHRIGTRKWQNSFKIPFWWFHLFNANQADC